MNEFDFQLADYYPIFLYVGVVLGVAAAIIAISQVFNPRRATKIKDVPYESGMDPIGDARQKFDVKFYLIAILFLVFDIELLFLYPWAVSAGGEHPSLSASFSPIVFGEIISFFASLVVAYIYAYRKGVFRWR
jgi:NADH-quinone oxidoreductase subunit A